MASMRTPKNVITGVIVTAVCVVCVLLIYHFTVGAKVSARAPEGAESSLRAPTGVSAPPGTEAPRESHAVPVPDTEAVTKPAGEKRPEPPAGR